MVCYQVRCNEKETITWESTSFTKSTDGVSYDAMDLDEAIQSFISQMDFGEIPWKRHKSTVLRCRRPVWTIFRTRLLERATHCSILNHVKVSKQRPVGPCFLFEVHEQDAHGLEAQINIDRATLEIRESAPMNFQRFKRYLNSFILEITQQNLFTLGLDLTTEGGKLVDDMIRTSNDGMKQASILALLNFFYTWMKKHHFCQLWGNFLRSNWLWKPSIQKSTMLRLIICLSKIELMLSFSRQNQWAANISFYHSIGLFGRLW